MGAGHSHHAHGARPRAAARLRPRVRDRRAAQLGVRADRGGLRAVVGLDGAGRRCRAQPVRRAQPADRLGRRLHEPRGRPTRASPTATSRARSSPRWPMPGCCWWRSARSCSRRSTGCSTRAPVEGWTMIAVAGVGIVINGATALLFVRGRKHDINIRGAFLHMAADALVSVGVVVAGVAILLTGELLDRPGDQPGDRRGDRLGHLGAAQGQRQAGPARGARRDRRERGARLPRRACRASPRCTTCTSGR